jgi:hypothetical protein
MKFTIMLESAPFAHLDGQILATVHIDDGKSCSVTFVPFYQSTRHIPEDCDSQLSELEIAKLRVLKLLISSCP